VAHRRHVVEGEAHCSAHVLHVGSVTTCVIGSVTMRRRQFVSPSVDSTLHRQGSVFCVKCLQPRVRARYDFANVKATETAPDFQILQRDMSDMSNGMYEHVTKSTTV
jgi:hypothetical protein